ncbi:MAG: sodium:proton antiporter [Ruminococcaceae bacterium]|nr:sodium:proton antiporter [Oscillospiraceae bacterium]
MQTILCMAVVLLAGLIMSRLIKPLQLPAVTAYLIAGILIGPFCLGRLGIDGLGFSSLEQVEGFGLVADIALGFIAFAIGNEFRLSQLKETGKQATIIGIVQAFVATLAVDIALIIVHVIVGDKFSLAAAVTLGAIAAATAPAATLMVVRQYKAKGKLTDLLLPIVALDDAVGLIIFAVSFGIAKAFTLGHVNVVSIIVEPIIEIVLSIVLGAVLGVLLNFAERFFHSRSKRLSLAVTFVLLAVAISMLKFNVGGIHIGFSSLLVCMMLGTLFCNLCDFSEELMDRCDRWTAPLFIMFFVLSGAELDFSVFGDMTIIIIGIIYIIFRSLGKYFGTMVSAKAAGCDKDTVKYLGITLLPQAGVALGMSVIARQELGADGTIIRNIVLFGVLIYELFGPMATKIALTKAGNIIPEHRKSSRGVK